MPRRWSGVIRVAAQDANQGGIGSAFESALLRDLRELLKHRPLKQFLERLQSDPQMSALPAYDLIAALPSHNELAQRIADHLAAREAAGENFHHYIRGVVTDAFREIVAARIREMVTHVHQKHAKSAPEIARRLAGPARDAIAPVVAHMLDGARPPRPRRKRIDLDGDDLLGGL